MTNKDKWLACQITSPSPSIRLFCFPSAGGGTILYRSWRNDLPESIQVCPVKLPGREDRIREPLITDMDKMSAALMKGLSPHLTGRFAFFGHSMGALLAFELIRRLRDNGMPLPEHLFVSAIPVPETFSDEYCFFGAQKKDTPTLLRKLRTIGGTPEAVLNNPELLTIFIPIILADLKMLDNYIYHPSPPLECPITAFGGTEDSRTGEGLLDRWREQTTNAFNCNWFPGGHFYFDSDDQRKKMLSLITNYLEI